MTMAEELEAFRAYVTRALPRARITKDVDGWPIVPGRHGRLEWRGAEWRTGEARIYAHTDRARMVARLLAVKGVHRCQTGDTEATVWIQAEDAVAVKAVGELLRLRYRTARVWTPEQRRAVAERFQTRLQSDFRPPHAATAVW